MPQKALRHGPMAAISGEVSFMDDLPQQCVNAQPRFRRRDYFANESIVGLMASAQIS